MKAPHKWDTGVTGRTLQSPIWAWCRKFFFSKSPPEWERPPKWDIGVRLRTKHVSFRVGMVFFCPKEHVCNPSREGSGQLFLAILQSKKNHFCAANENRPKNCPAVSWAGFFTSHCYLSLAKKNTIFVSKITVFNNTVFNNGKRWIKTRWKWRWLWVIHPDFMLSLCILYRTKNHLFVILKVKNTLFFWWKSFYNPWRVRIFLINFHLKKKKLFPDFLGNPVPPNYPGFLVGPTSPLRTPYALYGITWDPSDPPPRKDIYQGIRTA